MCNNIGRIFPRRKAIIKRNSDLIFLWLLIRKLWNVFNQSFHCKIKHFTKFHPNTLSWNLWDLFLRSSIGIIHLLSTSDGPPDFGLLLDEVSLFGPWSTRCSDPLRAVNYARCIILLFKRYICVLLYPDYGICGNLSGPYLVANSVLLK